MEHCIASYHLSHVCTDIVKVQYIVSLLRNIVAFVGEWIQLKILWHLIDYYIMITVIKTWENTSILTIKIIFILLCLFMYIFWLLDDLWCCKNGHHDYIYTICNHFQYSWLLTNITQAYTKYCRLSLLTYSYYWKGQIVRGLLPNASTLPSIKSILMVFYRGR